MVEKLDSEDFQIFTLQNPANRVEYFLYDHGWIEKEKDTDTERPTTT